ncbi:hypothetical protein BGP77_16965 [Saccharospirillum sp. MSK14-1]|uniref:hypothetical protein n=1 Tax=Saccharospirillum sp. MSK14-1 TaxID=1897632 RepID=UPI000D35DFBA|nr:hypothetical protein [Saccharospirillum sp. MSK14-1]PTY38136.1 hypothetical protein BGP77_16965 [Saccharospirillum sp. MSK14-1]
MHRFFIQAIRSLGSLTLLMVGQFVGAEPITPHPEKTHFPPAAVLSLEFDDDTTLRFHWPKVSDARVYHLQHSTEPNGHFVDFAANLPATLLHYRVSLPLNDVSKHHFRLLSCNSAGCSTSNRVTLHHNSTNTRTLGLPHLHSDLFGSTLSLNNDGTVLAIGAPANQVQRITSAGTVYLYRHTAGQWLKPVMLTPDIAMDEFGYRVQLDENGQVMAISSRDRRRSATHIFTRQDNNKWQRGNVAPDSTTHTGSPLAGSKRLSLAGDVLAVATQYDILSQPPKNQEHEDIPLYHSKRFVEIFEQGPDGWQTPRRLWPSRYRSDAYFGYAISLSGDGQVLAVGAPALLSTNEPFPRLRGAVHLYQRHPNGHWVLQTTVRSADPHNANFFGHSVTLNGNGSVLAVGAFEHANAASTNAFGAGQVQLFTRTVSTDWQLNHTFHSPQNQRITSMNDGPTTQALPAPAWSSNDWEY